MLIGDTELPIEEFILFIFWVLTIAFNIFLFHRGHGSYSIKYEVMRNQRYFRIHQCACMVIEVIYKIFFTLPFLILAAIAILQAIRNPLQVLIISINGLIVLLLLYPAKRESFFVKALFLWILAFASQIITLFVYVQNQTHDIYEEISSIFYTANAMLLSLAMLSRQNTFWDVSQAVQLFPNEIKAINGSWLDEKKGLPTIFDGGLYKSLCKKVRYHKFLFLYLSSLVLLGIYAGLVWVISNSSLGVIGLISCIVYDIFIFAFNILETDDRSIHSVFALIFIGRFLSFVFGSQLWLFGYCLLYLFIGIFIGNIIIKRRLPLRQENKQKKKEIINAFKTPQFVIFILTVYILILIGAAYGGVSSSSQTSVEYNNVTIPLWQFALLFIIATWIIILFLASLQMITRNANKITSLTEYYFGIAAIQEYHLYILITYALVIGLGLYCFYFLLSFTALLATIFIPLIYLVLASLFDQWVKNQFQILADIDQFNQRALKRYNIRKKKSDALKNKKQKATESLIVIPDTMQALARESKLKIQERSEENTMMKIKSKKNESESQGSSTINEVYKPQEQELQAFVRLKNWRTEEGYMSASDYMNAFTPSDKRIITNLLLLILLLIGFSLSSKYASSSLFGVYFVVAVFTYLPLGIFYKIMHCLSQLLVGQLIASFLGLVLGLLVFSFNYNDYAYGVAWAGIYILICLYLLIQGIQKGMELKAKIILVVKIGIVILFLCIYVSLSVSLVGGIVIAIVTLLLTVGILPIYFLMVEGTIPKSIQIISGITISLIVIGTALAGFLLNIASNFAVYSFIAGFIYLTLFSIASVIAYSKQKNKYNEPHVYCCYGIPVYRFESDKQKLKSSQNHLILYNGASIVLIFYSASVAMLFDSKSFAIYALSIYLIAYFFQSILYSIKSYYEIGINKKELTPEIMHVSLMELQSKYMHDEFNGESSIDLKQLLEAKKKEVSKVIDEDQLDKSWIQIVQIHERLVKRFQEEEKFLFFWITLIQFHIFNVKKSNMLTLLKEVKQIQQELISEGVYIESTNLALNFQHKYQLVTKQIQSLNPFDYIKFQQILKNHRITELEKLQLHKSVAEEEKKILQIKQNQLFEKLKEEGEKNPDEKMAEFQKLLKKLGKKGVFTDEQFPPNNKVLGLPSLEEAVHEWRRPNPNQNLVKGGFSPYDVLQGAIGDCFLISSLGVLGQKWIRPAFGMLEGDQQIWKNSNGAYMIRFFKFSKEVYVIIDDYLPVDKEDKFAFAKSEDKDEIWPALLEKAYAKMYSSYNNIVGGKCHRVLSEFTNGFPFEIQLEGYRMNQNGLWLKVMNAMQNGYLLAGGSLAGSDKNASKRGIVYGHAYSILDAREVDDYKLMKLKNPHGTKGVQWNGDFSDQSESMTKRMMKKLDHVEAKDGIFWMKIEDFVLQFRVLYICAVFDEKWKRFEPINGQWTKQNSFGVPDRSSSTYKNPQYGIEVTKKSTIFINLSQEPLNALNGKNNIYMRMQSNQGKRISKQNVSSNKLCGSPLPVVDLVSLSTEISLEAESYPCLEEGQKGMYNLQMYCSDEKSKVIDDKDFDPVSR